MEANLINLHDLEIRAAKAEFVTWHKYKAFRLEDGQALAPDGEVKNARIEVLVGTEKPAYPGIVPRS